MPKCKNDILLNKIWVNKLDTSTEVDFAVIDDLPDCKRIMANNYVSTSVANPVYNAYKRPANRFECEDGACMTGTLTLGAAGNVVYKVQTDATDWASGVITFYTQNTGTTSTTITVDISDDNTFEDADQYSVTIGASDVTDDGYVPVIIDLSQAPADEEGDGWTPSANGAFIKIASTTSLVVSSISIFDSMEDFEISDVVTVGCISGIEGTDDIEAAEATCITKGYDRSTAPTFERTITGTQITPNYWKLNPFVDKGEATQGFKTMTIAKAITSVTVGSATYGMIPLVDMSDDCGFMTIQIEDNCNVTDAHLERLSVPSLVALEENQYVVIDNASGGKNVYFNANLVGVTVKVKYPQIANVEERIADFENIGTRKVKMSYRIHQSDNIEIVRTYNNVLVTSFPNTINRDSETEFAFTINIQMDNDGHYYKDWIVRV